MRRRRETGEGFDCEVAGETPPPEPSPKGRGLNLPVCLALFLRLLGLLQVLVPGDLLALIHELSPRESQVHLVGKRMYTYPSNRGHCNGDIMPSQRAIVGG